MTEKEIQAFYESPEWKDTRAEVLDELKNECQACKAKGYFKKAILVHHVNWIKLHPELKLAKWYVDGDGVIRRNLVPLCFLCHKAEHKWLDKKKADPITPERW